MLVRFTKGPLASPTDTLTCVSDAGAAVSLEMVRQGVLPRLAIQFVVESTLGIRDGWFGRIAKGDAPPSRGRSLSPTNICSDLVAQCLETEQWGGASPADVFARRLTDACRKRRIASPTISSDALDRIRTNLREFGATWRPLPPGGSVEREWR